MKTKKCGPNKGQYQYPVGLGWAGGQAAYLYSVKYKSAETFYTQKKRLSKEKKKKPKIGNQ